MTEAEWLECTNPQKMLEFLRGKASHRKLRLFGVACCRRWEDEFPNQETTIAVNSAERYADDLLPFHSLNAARKAAEANPCPKEPANSLRCAAAVLCALDIADSIFSVLEWIIWFKKQIVTPPFLPSSSSTQAHLLRDIFANPLRPVTILPAVLAWNDGTMQKIAQAIYDERAFDRLPIFADALEEAGCSDLDILNHCRQPGEHVRGCWVVDLLLGKP